MTATEKANAAYQATYERLTSEESSFIDFMTGDHAHAMAQACFKMVRNPNQPLMWPTFFQPIRDLIHKEAMKEYDAAYAEGDD